MSGQCMDYFKELPRADANIDGSRSKAVQTNGGGVEGHSQRGNPDHPCYFRRQLYRFLSATD